MSQKFLSGTKARFNTKKVHMAEKQSYEKLEKQILELEKKESQYSQTWNSLKLNEARLEALLELSLKTGESKKVLVDFALEQAIFLTNSTIGYLAFMNEDETILSMYSWSKQAMKNCEIFDKPIDYFVMTTGLWGEAVRQRKPVVTNDYTRPNPFKKGLPKGHIPLDRHMNVPIFEGDKIVAVAGVGNKQNPYDESDVRQLTLLIQGMWTILKRRASEAVLIKSEERFKILSNLTFEGILTHNKGVVIDVNDTLINMLDYTREELIGKNIIHLCVPREYHNIIQKNIVQKSAAPYEIMLRKKNGTIFPAEIEARDIESKKFRVAALRDITGRKQTESALIKNEQELRSIFRAAPTGIGMVCDRIIQKVNNRFCEMT
ncbi:MAG: GAF domain-containing protein, partial [Desulfobacteraceae bacterium]|nr:GAF domain-containing protein [Desulfobacteraceae bacterium]